MAVMGDQAIDQNGAPGKSMSKIRILFDAFGPHRINGPRRDIHFRYPSSITSRGKESYPNWHNLIIAKASRKVIATAVTGLMLVGCANSNESPQTITILAAASMTQSLTEIAQEFQQDNPKTRIRTSFAGSGTLAAQVRAGIPADVLITASRESMLRAGPRARVSGIFAKNVVVLASISSKVTSVADLNTKGVIWVRCDDAVPCGAAAKSALLREGVTSRPASLESDVNGVVGRLLSGEADAGVVYRSDAVEHPQWRAIRFASPSKVELYVSRLRDSKSGKVADRFVDYLVNSGKVFEKHGFETVK